MFLLAANYTPGRFTVICVGFGKMGSRVHKNVALTTARHHLDQPASYELMAAQVAREVGKLLSR
jgi:hypothetical protein